MKRNEKRKSLVGIDVEGSSLDNFLISYFAGFSECSGVMKRKEFEGGDKNKNA